MLRWLCVVVSSVSSVGSVCSVGCVLWWLCCGWLCCNFGCVVVLVVWLFCSLVVLVVLCFQVLIGRCIEYKLTRYVMFIIFHCHCRCCCG